MIGVGRLGNDSINNNIQSLNTILVRELYLNKPKSQDKAFFVKSIMDKYKFQEGEGIEEDIFSLLDRKINQGLVKEEEVYRRNQDGNGSFVKSITYPYFVKKDNIKEGKKVASNELKKSLSLPLKFLNNSELNKYENLVIDLLNSYLTTNNLNEVKLSVFKEYLGKLVDEKPEKFDVDIQSKNPGLQGLDIKKHVVKILEQVIKKLIESGYLNLSGSGKHSKISINKKVLGN